MYSYLPGCVQLPAGERAATCRGACAATCRGACSYLPGSVKLPAVSSIWLPREVVWEVSLCPPLAWLSSPANIQETINALIQLLQLHTYIATQQRVRVNCYIYTCTRLLAAGSTASWIDAIYYEEVY